MRVRAVVVGRAVARRVLTVSKFGRGRVVATDGGAQRQTSPGAVGCVGVVDEVDGAMDSERERLDDAG